MYYILLCVVLLKRTEKMYLLWIYWNSYFCEGWMNWRNVTSWLLLTTLLLLALNPHYIRPLKNIVTVQYTDSQLALDSGSWRTISNGILPEIKKCLTFLELELERRPHRAMKSIRGREATLVKSNFPLISSALIQGWEALIINREEQRQINSS